MSISRGRKCTHIVYRSWRKRSTQALESTAFKVVDAAAEVFYDKSPFRTFITSSRIATRQTVSNAFAIEPLTFCLEASSVKLAEYHVPLVVYVREQVFVE